MFIGDILYQSRQSHSLQLRASPNFQSIKLLKPLQTPRISYRIANRLGQPSCTNNPLDQRLDLLPINSHRNLRNLNNEPRNVLLAQALLDSFLQVLHESFSQSVRRLHNHEEEDGFVRVKACAPAADAEGVGDDAVEGGCFDYGIDV